MKKPFGKSFHEKMDKRGSLIGTTMGDLVIASAIMFAMALTFLIGAYFWSQIQGNTNLFPEDNIASQRIEDAATKTYDMLPYIFILIVAGIYLGLLITAHFVNVSPVFIIAGIIVMILSILISIPLSNVWEQITLTSELGGSTSRIINLIMLNLPYTMFLLGLGFFIILYVKRPEEVFD